jgi:hypothetical protein
MIVCSEIDQQGRLRVHGPPYNVLIDGHVCGLGRIRHANFVMGCGEMSEAEFMAFLERCSASWSITPLMARSISSAWTGPGNAAYAELKNV